jgi:formate dehydrogenase subunit beta
VPNDRQVWVTLRADGDRPGDWRSAEQLAEALGLEPTAEPQERIRAVRDLVAARTAERDRRFALFAERVHDPLSLLSEFATCIRCQNCMVACPICYCRECIFRTDTFDHPSSRYWDWADRKGGVRLPSDTLLFHVTRMLHMAHACVGCGMCSDACPVDIPVADIFRAVGHRVQQSFGYVPGRDPDEEMIIATFREDELGTLGESE